MPLLCILITAVTVAGELTESQLSQVQSATDDSPILDEAAWYPLLKDASKWPEDARPGSVNPDYTAILNNPKPFRGRRFLLRGQFAGKPRHWADLKVGRLARSGPWDDRLEQWGIVVAENPEFVVMVNLVAPPAMPRERALVEIVGRFYKIWQTPDLYDRPRRFLVFVGKNAHFPPQPSRDSSFLRGMLALVLAIGFFWFILRKMTRKERPRSRGARKRHLDYATVLDDNQRQQNLPDDPVAALRELEKQHGSML